MLARMAVCPVSEVLVLCKTLLLVQRLYSSGSVPGPDVNPGVNSTPPTHILVALSGDR